MSSGSNRLRVWPVVQFCLLPFLDDRRSLFPEGSANRRKQLERHKGTDAAYALVRKHKIRAAWGTDTLFDANVADPAKNFLVVMKDGKVYKNSLGAQVR